MIRTRTLLAFSLLISLCEGCSERNHHEGPLPQANERTGYALDLRNYFESGRLCVLAYADHFKQSKGIDLLAVIDRCKLGCLRAQVHFNHTATSLQTNQGSAVLIAHDTFALTAGHLFDGITPKNMEVFRTDGNSYHAELLHVEHTYPDRDLAILKLKRGALLTANEDKPTPEFKLAKAVVGELAICLGYPDGVGVRQNGKTDFMPADSYAYFEPIPVLVEVEKVEENHLVLKPLAGAAPIGGMSGGPVFNTEGNLIGIFVAITKHSEDGDTHQTFKASTLHEVEDRINKK